MDAQTHPHGVLEEMEASPHQMEKPAEAGNIQQKCGYSCQLQKGILADSIQPNIANSPLKQKVEKAEFQFFYSYYRKSVAA